MREQRANTEVADWRVAKRNAALSVVISPSTPESLKEWAGLGHTLVMMARRP